MKPNSQNPHEAANTERAGRPESPQSKETFPHRTERPGEAGLANEKRPGLGSRGPAEEGAPQRMKPVQHDNEPLGRHAPQTPREPREQKADSAATALEHDTGASGKMGLK